MSHRSREKQRIDSRPVSTRHVPVVGGILKTTEDDVLLWNGLGANRRCAILARISCMRPPMSWMRPPPMFVLPPSPPKPKRAIGLTLVEQMQTLYFGIHLIRIPSLPYHALQRVLMAREVVLKLNHSTTGCSRKFGMCPHYSCRYRSSLLPPRASSRQYSALA